MYRSRARIRFKNYLDRVRRGHTKEQRADENPTLATNSRASVRKHAHKRIGRFPFDKRKSRQIPKVPEPARNVLPQKIECKSFLSCKEKNLLDRNLPGTSSTKSGYDLSRAVSFGLTAVLQTEYLGMRNLAPDRFRPIMTWRWPSLAVRPNPPDGVRDCSATLRRCSVLLMAGARTAARSLPPLVPRLHAAGQHDRTGPGFGSEFAAPLPEVLEALEEVLQDQTIHGTYVFDKERTLTGAKAVESTPLFGPWSNGGKGFFKIRMDPIAPRHFSESADQGTIAVRYVVTSVSPERTRLRIDAIFVEKSHRVAHASDGTVETSEYKAIEDRLQAIQSAQQEAADAQRHRESIELAQQTLLRQREDESTRLATAQSSARDLEHRLDALQHEVERRVKAPGARLKAAPFLSAANIAELAAYTEVVVVIVTPHWLGVETPQSKRGWLN